MSAAKEPLDFWSLRGTRKTVQNNRALWPKLFPFVRHVFDRRTETGFYCSEISFCIMNHFRASPSLIWGVKRAAAASWWHHLHPPQRDASATHIRVNESASFQRSVVTRKIYMNNNSESFWYTTCLYDGRTCKCSVDGKNLLVSCANSCLPYLSPCVVWSYTLYLSM